MEISYNHSLHTVYTFFHLQHIVCNFLLNRSFIENSSTSPMNQNSIWCFICKWGNSISCLIFLPGNDLGIANEFLRYLFSSFIQKPFTIMVPIKNNIKKQKRKKIIQSRERESRKGNKQEHTKSERKIEKKNKRKHIF